MPFVWIAEAERKAIEAALVDDPTVDTFELVTDLGGRWLYQLEWIESIETFRKHRREASAEPAGLTSGPHIAFTEYSFPHRQHMGRV